MNRQLFNANLDLLAHAWPQAPLTEQRLAAYWIGLSDLDDSVFTAAVQQCVRTCRFFPAVAELRAAAEEILTQAGVMPVEPEEAWIHVLSRAKRWHPGMSGRFDDPSITRALVEIGGISAVALASNDEVGWLRKSFLARYSVYRRRALDSRGLPVLPWLDVTQGAPADVALTEGPIRNTDETR